MSSTNPDGVTPNINGGPFDGGHLPSPTRERYALMFTPYGAKGPIPDSIVYLFDPQRERWIFSSEVTEAARKPKP